MSNAVTETQEAKCWYGSECPLVAVRSLGSIQFEGRTTVVPGQTENITGVSTVKRWLYTEMDNSRKKCCWSSESTNCSNTLFPNHSPLRFKRTSYLIFQCFHWDIGSNSFFLFTHTHTHKI